MNAVNLHTEIAPNLNRIASDDRIVVPVDTASINTSQASARWYCEQLERGRILYFERTPFGLPAGSRQLVFSHRSEATRLHKNISYHPKRHRLCGFAGDRRIRTQVCDLLRDYSAVAREFVERVLPTYAGKWKLDVASFRNLEERGRALPLRKRNDLLHVDAFPPGPRMARAS